jgi:hypothetical protein
MGRNQARRRGEVNHGRASARLNDHCGKSRVVTVGEFRRTSRAWGTSSFGVVHSSTILWTAGRIFEDGSSCVSRGYNQEVAATPFRAGTYPRKLERAAFRRNCLVYKDLW